jgi:hypothetical protein
VEAGGTAPGGAGGEPAATGGTTAGGAGGAGDGGGAGGEGGAVAACLGGDVVGDLDAAYEDCSEWAADVFGTQQCSAGDPWDNGPLGDDLCWYYLPAARSDVLDALLGCFAEYSGTDCPTATNTAHDDHMWDCVADVGARACPTTDGTELCATVTDDCGDVTTEFCESEVNLVVETERSAIGDCWTGLSNGQRTGATCADSFEGCI